MAQVFGLYKIPTGMRIPGEWFDSVVDAIDYLYKKSLEHDKTLDCIEAYMGLLAYYARTTAAGKGIKTRVVSVGTSPVPLYVDELDVRKIIIKVPSDALYAVYLGDSESQDFVLEKGEQVTLRVKTTKNIYLKATGQQNVFALFELAE